MDAEKIIGVIVGIVFVVENCTANPRKIASLNAATLQKIVETAVSKGQQPLMQRVMELEQQQKVLLENLHAKPQNPKKRGSAPFVSVNNVRKYVEEVNNGTVERKDVRGRIDATVDHILQAKERIFVPSNVPEME